MIHSEFNISESGESKEHRIDIKGKSSLNIEDRYE